MALIRFSWCQTPDKRVEIGEEYAFVETMRRPKNTNSYRGKVVDMSTTGEQIEVDIEVTRKDANKRYNIGEIIKRMWHKEDGHSGTTLIYKNYAADIDNPSDTVDF